jgi:hypothetical protein
MDKEMRRQFPRMEKKISMYGDTVTYELELCILRCIA